MKLAFIVDKTQTLQIIVKLIKTSLEIGHDVNLFCCFDKNMLGSVSSYLGDNLEKINWFWNTNRNEMINELTKNRDTFDCVLGINFFNRSLEPVFKNSNTLNYGFEYCWNEIYNAKKDFNSNGTLFCNSSHTLRLISELSGYKKLLNVGSPWFEYLSEQKPDRKEKKIVFMSPHNSFYAKKQNLKAFVEKLLISLRNFCDSNDYKLYLKTRSKYNNSEKRYIKFDDIASDKIAGNHIEMYKDASLVINFCSSAINELAYLQVPYLIIGPEIQKDLHTDMSCDAGIKKIHDIFYSGSIIDKIHCDSLSLSNDFDENLMNQKIESLLKSKKNWKDFQETYFAGDCKNSSVKILEIINNERIKKNTDN